MQFAPIFISKFQTKIETVCKYSALPNKRIKLNGCRIWGEFIFCLRFNNYYCLIHFIGHLELFRVTKIKCTLAKHEKFVPEVKPSWLIKIARTTMKKMLLITALFGEKPALSFCFKDSLADINSAHFTAKNDNRSFGINQKIITTNKFISYLSKFIIMN